MANANIRVVAKKAGVSTATVSRSFTHPELVSASTRKKVIKVAEELNFNILRSAAALKSGRSFRIALLLNDPVTTWFNSHVFKGLNDVLQGAGYDISIYTITTVEERKDFFSSIPVRRNADAVVVCSFNTMTREIAQLKAMNVPIVGINIPDTTGFDAAVAIDDRASMLEAVRHLTGIGHRHIAYIHATHGTPFTYRADQRIEGFIQGCKETDQNIRSTVINCPFEPDPVNSAVSQLLAIKPRPTALCFQTDDLAIPVLFRLQHYGRKVPSDFSMIGFDDAVFAREIGLTTLHQDPVELSKLAASKILDLIAGRELKKPYEIESARLILRETTATYRE